MRLVIQSLFIVVIVAASLITIYTNKSKEYDENRLIGEYSREQPNKKMTSDPLGQDPRPPGSIPNTSKYRNNISEKKVIRRIQFTLSEEGYYSGDINGVLSDDTKTAIDQYRSDNNILEEKYLGKITMTAFGIGVKSGI